MRIKVTIDAKDLLIPMDYQHILQAAIYGLMDNADEVHDERTFKHFCFSLLQGNFEKTDGNLLYLDRASFIVSSSDREMILSIINHLEESKRIRIGRKICFVRNIEVLLPYVADEAYVDFLSPVSVHTTTEDRKTIYYSPFEEEFKKLLMDNFKHKCDISEEKPFEIDDIYDVRKCLMKYKGFVIEGYKMKCHISSKKEYIKLMLDLGLGDRNSSGFGMITTSNHRF